MTTEQTPEQRMAEIERRVATGGFGLTYNDAKWLIDRCREHAAEIERLKALVREGVRVAEDWCDRGVDHDPEENGDDCPEDDCCRCEHVARINAFHKHAREAGLAKY